MDKRMVAGIVKNGLDQLIPHNPVKFPPMGWFFADNPPSDAISPDKGVCMLSHIGSVNDGKPLCFSSDQSGCGGASCYLGFTEPSAEAGRFLADKEHFKKTTALGNAFYESIQARRPKSRFLILQAVTYMDDQAPVEVVTLWTDGEGLAGLVTLANYDRASNNNVIIPFASGCQSIWTIPYKEKGMNEPRAVVGCMDPAVRSYLDKTTVSFSLPAERFVEITDNIAGSFLENKGTYF